MLRAALLGAVVVALQGDVQDMPVARLSGPVVGQSPATASAQAPRAAGQLPPLPATQIDPGQITLDSPRRLSLTFLEPRPIDEVLALLTAGTGFSVAIDADAAGTFRGELKQLTLRESLATVLAPLGLDFRVQGTVIRIQRRQVETRLFDLDAINIQRGFSRTTGSSAAALSSSVVQEDVATSIGDGVKALLSERGTVHVDRRAGLVQVTDFSDRLDRVALYIETLHQRRARQVRLQAQAFEVTLHDGPAIDWRLVRERLGLPRDASDAGIATDPVALRQALALQGDVRMLWAPDVTALNNEPAVMRMATPGGRSLTMTIVPQVSADGIIQISVAHAWEERAGERRDGLFKSVPLMRISESDTVMRVLDGKTALIAGLLRPTEIDVPSRRLSSMFGGSSKRSAQAELVVLLRPSVVLP